MATATILILEKLWPLLYNYTNPHQIRRDCCESNMERNHRVRYAYLQKLNMVAAAILVLEQLLSLL